MSIGLKTISSRAVAGRLVLECPYCKNAAYLSVTILQLAKIRVFGEQVVQAECVGYVYRGTLRKHKFNVRLH